MKIVQTLLLTFCLITFGVNDATAINFNPGNYEIKTWIELPDGGSGMGKKQLHYLKEDNIISKMYIP